MILYARARVKVHLTEEFKSLEGYAEYATKLIDMYLKGHL